MQQRIAVMDLGTNTFHLFIAEKTGNQLNAITRRVEAVKLGEGGINDGLIQQQAFERGIDTMISFWHEINTSQVTGIRAIATSAIRNAKNGSDFIAEVKKATGIEIEIIDGIAEADFIYKGVKTAGCLSPEDALIMDIGGGSVEFIIGNSEEIKWKQSFEIGAARLMDMFHRTDPVPAEAVKRLQELLDKKLGPLFKAVETFPVKHLIGSSGAFETFAEMIEAENHRQVDINSIKAYNFGIEDFLRTASKLQKSSHAERLTIRGIIPLRIDMIVTAAVLTRFIIEKLQIENLSMTTYSLKEGVMSDMFANGV